MTTQNHTTSASVLKDLNAVRAMIRRHKRSDFLFASIGLIALMSGLLTLLVLFVDLVMDGYPRFNLQFLSDFPSRRAGSAGLLSAWVGSALVMLVTFLTAVPMGVGAGIYLEEYAPKNWFSDLIEINVSNLAGVPSIIYGLLALGLFVYGLDLGQSILTAGLTLGLLILPIVIVSTRESIRAIPVAIREAAYAVGATKWQVVKDHVIKYSRGGILTGVIIGMSRAIGETAPIITIGALTFIAFLPPAPITDVAPYLNFEWLSSSFTVLPIQMFNWLSRPEHAFHINAAAAGAIIIFVTLLMNATAIYLRYQIRKNIKW
ncbi:MAG: phosphate ABC transporter permease PstA [Methylotenera sp.]|uniref:phosphate ABC transporter permease PstA n=1 Tax=Methylotenera sp. TaxID=2051956 RepID=UPI00271A013F|nr:phosphate ABC transporter permease PstA [Methylotenera sp.]MDO9204769.1 phosphate ABC transporter permease PstA [Methylotenera sp.]MDO9394779.1 phosphate ABC transporter permease PstA [Methylotenera sp.]MDP1522197.1 phosphate ABC transporter permease PstA [Methylotenera sp.]MDP3308714.1 phosphate ABC transporter permease PstA [Methylotenera sp.]MDP3818848.1 phosphate ABC transporter permease PstA [Methylotenera sp.]